MTFLFLDDIRTPESAFNYTKFSFFLTEKWDIVRNYDEFVKYISINTIPDFISFDHDLAEIHYDPKTWKEGFVYTEKTGYDCAKWLTEYCLDNNLNLPKFYCHSMNPIGKKRILDLLNNFKKT